MNHISALVSVTESFNLIRKYNELLSHRKSHDCLTNGDKTSVSDNSACFNEGHEQKNDNYLHQTVEREGRKKSHYF